MEFLKELLEKEKINHCMLEKNEEQIQISAKSSAFHDAFFPLIPELF